MTKEAKVKYHVWLATENGFPDTKEARIAAKRIYTEVCNEDDREATRQLQLFETNKQISENIVAIVSVFYLSPYLATFIPISLYQVTAVPIYASARG